jgi:pilus assembly protein Flp/PilA
MFEFVYRFLLDTKMRIDKNERGASAVEYGLLIAGIAAAIAIVVFTLGAAIAGLFTTMVGAITPGP